LIAHPEYLNAIADAPPISGQMVSFRLMTNFSISDINEFQIEWQLMHDHGTEVKPDLKKHWATGIVQTSRLVQLDENKELKLKYEVQVRWIDGPREDDDTWFGWSIGMGDVQYFHRKYCSEIDRNPVKWLVDAQPEMIANAAIRNPDLFQTIQLLINETDKQSHDYCDLRGKLLVALLLIRSRLEVGMALDPAWVGNHYISPDFVDNDRRMHADAQFTGVNWEIKCCSGNVQVLLIHTIAFIYR
jgi:hypothetical protein